MVALRSHDFTGLGFNICGNMKEGIYIKDVLHRGPASESGKLNPGDRINSVTISFEHMVYEDALTILSYASPYEVIIEARGGKIIHQTQGQGAQPSHPVYRSSSCADLYQVCFSPNFYLKEKIILVFCRLEILLNVDYLVLKTIQVHLVQIIQVYKNLEVI